MRSSASDVSAQKRFIVEFLNPIFDVAARTIDAFIDEAGRLPEIGDDKARVVAGGATRQTHHFGFDHDAALVVPRARGIARLGIDANASVMKNVRVW